MNIKKVEVDLVLITLLVGILLVTVFTNSLSWVRVILGIPQAFFFPGYVLIGALFPRKDSLKQVNRLALSLGFSIVIVVLTGLMLNYFPWGIGLYSIIISISILILFLSIITWYTRRRYHPDERYGIAIRPPDWNLINHFRSLNQPHLSLIIFTAFLVVGFAVFVSYTMARPPEKAPFTEFYILGVENRADAYPLDLKSGEEGAVIIGIVNHEYETTDYRLEVVIDENKLYELFPIVLEPGEKWHQEIKFTLERVAQKQKVEFRLSQDTEQSGAVRYLWVNAKA